MKRSSMNRLTALETKLDPPDVAPFFVTNRETGQPTFIGWVGQRRPAALLEDLSGYDVHDSESERIGTAQLIGGLQ